MKTTIVPAQITTVEDRVAGSLSFKQLLLLIVPVFIGGAIYLALPPFASFSTLKIALAVFITLMSVILAIRIKGKLVLEWIVIRTKYNLRPRYFVYDKNTSYLRTKTKDQPKESTQETIIEDRSESVPQISVSKLIPAENFALDPRANFEFRRNKKGGLNVSFKEIK